MIVLSRCYIPVNTVTRIVVFVPAKAEYETGFRQWVEAMASLANEVGCRLIFCANAQGRSLIAGVISRSGFGIRHEYRQADGIDDFMLLSNRVLDDDLLVVIGARHDSVSYTPEMTDIALFLQRYFDRNNLLLIYPAQFGETRLNPEDSLTTFADPLRAGQSSAPTLLRALRARIQRFRRKHR